MGITYNNNNNNNSNSNKWYKIIIIIIIFENSVKLTCTLASLRPRRWLSSSLINASG